MRPMACVWASVALNVRVLSLFGFKPLWVLLGLLCILINPVQAEDDVLPGEGVTTLPPIQVSGSTAAFEWSSRYHAVRHHLHDAADTHDIDIALLKAVIATESRFHPGAVSSQGAVGLMQLMPSTARLLGLKGEPKTSLQRKLSDPSVNLQIGSAYLRYLINLFPGQIELALAAYNAGEGTVKRAGNRLGNLKQHTRHYVKTVMGLYGQLKLSPAAQAPYAAATESNGYAPLASTPIPSPE